MSKSKDLIKKHSESVTHNTLGNIITVGLSWGGAAVMSSLAAYSAFLYGLPLYLLIFWGAVVFLIFAAALNFIHLFIVRRRRLLAGAVDEAKALPEMPLDETTKEALNAQHQSRVETLQRDHEEQIRARTKGFDTLKRQHDGLKARLADWENYNWLVGLALKQADAINQYVTLERIERAEASLHDADGIPYIRFHFYIINKSVFDITVELENNARDSYIVFSYIGLKEPLDLKSERFFGIPNGELHISNLGIGCLTVEQRLSPMEAHTIARGEGKDDAIFHFDRLVFRIKGSNRQPPVDEKWLEIDKAITLNNDLLPRR